MDIWGQSKNSGFFLPVTMSFILFFSTLIIFISLFSLTNLLIVKNFENEVYYEISILRSKNYIKQTITDSMDILSMCMTMPYVHKDPAYTIIAYPKCFNNDKETEDAIAKLRDEKTFRMEEDKFNYFMLKSNSYVPASLQLAHIYNKFGDKIKGKIPGINFSHPIVRGIVFMLEKGLKPDVSNYTSFVVEIWIDDVRTKIIYFYDYNLDEGITIRYN